MPLFLKVNGKLIPLNENYDNAADAAYKDYPKTMFDVWEEKGKIIIQVKKPDDNQKHMRTPGQGQCFY